TTAGAGVFGVRVHADRAGVVELGGGRARGRGGGVLERRDHGAALGGRVVAGLVVGDRVEGVAAVDGLAFRGRDGVAEARAAVAVGVREAEGAVAGLLDVEVDARHAAARRRIARVRVHADRAGVVELGGGRARGGGGGEIARGHLGAAVGGIAVALPVACKRVEGVA